MSSTTSTWLCPLPSDRERLLDMDARIKPTRVITLAVLGVALALAAIAGQEGWWTMLPLAVAAVAFGLAERGLHRVAHPEYAVAAAWLTTQLAIAASVALTGMVGSPATAWLALAVVTLPARFGPRGVGVGLAITTALMLLCTVGLEPGAVVDAPAQVLFPLALLTGLAVLSTALMRSDVQHRGEAIIDPLTGMLNRGALQARLPEIAAQAKVNQRPVGVVVLDLDHFKAVNDGHGHATGDEVLQEVAYRIRKQLRAYELAYRLGGEEFLVLLPGCDLAHATHLAEELRAAVEASPIAGLRCTTSCGVSASAPGLLDYDAAFAAADEALYEAKAAGRNRVHAQPLGGVAGAGALVTA